LLQHESLENWISFKTIEEAQDKICPPHWAYEPDKSEQVVYDELYAFFSKLYFAFGSPGSGEFCGVLPKLIQLARFGEERKPAEPGNRREGVGLRSAGDEHPAHR
jgi:hypothetical protein